MRFFKYNVKLHLKSGTTVKAKRLRSLKKRYSGNELTGLEWEGKMPFYIRLEDISAIETQAVLNWRGIFIW